MADFNGFMKGRCTLRAANAPGQAQCGMPARENVIHAGCKDVFGWRRLSQLNDNRHKEIAFNGRARHG
jgi:hypothetical protein